MTAALTVPIDQPEPVITTSDACVRGEPLPPGWVAPIIPEFDPTRDAAYVTVLPPKARLRYRIRFPWGADDADGEHEFDLVFTPSPTGGWDIDMPCAYSHASSMASGAGVRKRDSRGRLRGTSAPSEPIEFGTARITGHIDIKLNPRTPIGGER